MFDKLGQVDEALRLHDERVAAWALARHAHRARLGRVGEADLIDLDALSGKVVRDLTRLALEVGGLLPRRRLRAFHGFVPHWRGAIDSHVDVGLGAPS